MADGSIAQIRRVCEYIQTHLATDIAVAELASQVNLSPHHFSMLFKQALGVPPHQYVLQARIREAQRQLATGRAPISEVALRLGFSDQSHFSRAFRKVTGTTPARWGKVALALTVRRDPPGCPPPAAE